MIFRVFIFFYIFTVSTSLWGVGVSLDLARWHKVKYAKVKANTVRQVKNRLQISVNNSSSALVYTFDKPISVKKVGIKAEIKGEINYGQTKPGDKGSDDFPIRLGFILKGKSHLNFFQKTIAPTWLIELNKISSRVGGVDKVYSLIFYSKKPSFNKREHPLSPYFFEEVAGKFINSKLRGEHSFSEEKKTIGLWLSSDGDDTHSSYDVIIEDVIID